jgi:DNA-binding MarR family transcriptional regulator
VIRITEAGRELVYNARNLYDQAVRRYVIDVLSPDQLRSLAEISEALLAGLDDTRAIPCPTPGSRTSPAGS